MEDRRQKYFILVENILSDMGVYELNAEGFRSKLIL